MADPEQLHAEGVRLGQRRSWLALGVALVVLAGLVAFRVGAPGQDPAPVPAPSPTQPSPRSQAWPAGLPPGTLYVVAGGSLSTIDTADGAPTSTGVEATSGATMLTPLADGVLVWRPGTRAGRALLVDGLTVGPVLGRLRTATGFLPGPDGRVWASEGSRSGRATWRLVDAEGRASTSVVVDGSAAGDGAGGLLAVGRQGFRPVFPRPGRSVQPGEVIATGPDGYLVRSCAEAECRFVLHRRTDGAKTNLRTAVGEDTSGGSLSPANRLLAVVENVGGTTTLRVSVVATGEVKDIFAEPRPSADGAVWLDDRWLALVSEDRLVLYDAVDDRVVTPDVPLGDLGPLAWHAS